MEAVTAPFAARRAEAQRIHISVDLVAAAKRELQLLKAVDRFPCLYSGPSVSEAIRRYEVLWLPLLAEQRQPDGLPLVPPLDVHWVWHVHRLAPVAYARDCEAMFGRVLDCPPHTFVLPDSALSQAEDVTRKLWRERYGQEAYDFRPPSPAAGEADPAARGPAAASVGVPMLGAVVGQPAEGRPLSEGDVGGPGTGGGGAGSVPRGQLRIVHDLTAAILRQKDFYYQVSDPFFADDRFLQAAAERYKQFLFLMKYAPWQPGQLQFSVPTYDIDVMWHAHQLSPVAYAADTTALYGRVKDHDDTDSNRAPGQKLTTAFAETSAHWELMFGGPYLRAGAMYKGDRPEAPPPPPQAVGTPVFAPWQAGPPRPAWNVNAEVYGLTERMVMQAWLVVFGGHNLPAVPKAEYYIQVTGRGACRGLKLHTKRVVAGPAPAWREPWLLQCEAGTVGVTLKLKCKKTGLRGKVAPAKCAGEAAILWRELLATPTLSVDKLLPLTNANGPSPGGDAKAPALLVGASVTPPVEAPYLLMMVPAAAATDDLGQMVAPHFAKQTQPATPQEGRWLTRTVVDHKRREKFVVRTRMMSGTTKLAAVPRGDRKIVIHKGRWELTTTYGVGHVRNSLVLLEVLELPPGTPGPAALQQCGWSSDRFTAAGGSPPWRLWVSLPEPARGAQGLGLALQSLDQSQAQLLLGRRLQYEVRGAAASQEEGFVTLVRYSPEAPLGKATALFNWKSGGLEVSPEEDAVVVLALSAAIALSFFDLGGGGADAKRRSRRRPRVRTPQPGDEWGSMVVQRGPGGGPGVGAGYGMWWSYDYLMWNNLMIYDYAIAAGAGCGGGACGAGACGASGGVCGAGASCGGGDGGGGGCGGGCGGCGGCGG